MALYFMSLTMNILKFVTIVCTMYSLVSGAPQSQQPGDPRSCLPRTPQWEDISHIHDTDSVKRNRRQNWEPTLNVTNSENSLLNIDIFSNFRNMKQDEKDIYNYVRKVQSLSSQYDQIPPPPSYDHRPSSPPHDHRPPPPPHDHRPPPPPTYDHREPPPPPPHDHRPPPPPPYDHRPPPQPYDHRPPPFSHYDHRLPPPPPPSQYDPNPPPHDHTPPPSSRFYVDKPSPPEREPQHYYNKYDYNNWSNYRPPPSFRYDERQIRELPYYDRSFIRGGPPPPHNEGRLPPSSFHFNDRPPPPPHNNDGPNRRHERPSYQDRVDSQYPPPPPHDDRRPPPPPHYDHRPPPHGQRPPPNHHRDDPHYPPPFYSERRPPPPPPPRDSLSYDNRPVNSRPFSSQEFILDTQWENTMAISDNENKTRLTMPNNEVQNKVIANITDTNGYSKNDDNFMSLIDVRFAEDNGETSSTLKTENTALKNSMDNNSQTQEGIPKFMQLLFQAIPVTPES